ncbi:MAG: glycosyltransferase [Armatimonadota bacterium]|nr:glycosyltransferase [Armatimonadota bacterium]
MRVTVGISFFNNETTLADAIRSVFAQTFQDWELLLINDGSTDGSLAIALSVDDPRVKVISDGENRGAPYRLNRITELARGEYIARMDGDDIMRPDRLAQQVEYLDANPNADIVSNGIYIIDGENNLIGVRCLDQLDASPDAALRRGILVQGSAMGRAEWWRKYPYDASYRRAEENELWCRSCKSSTFGKIPRPLYFCREQSKTPTAYLRDYMQSGRTLRRIYRKYGPSFVGWPQTAALIGQAYLKGEIYRAATYLGLQGRLISRRNRDLTPCEWADAEEALRTVMQTQVPGLPDAGFGTEVPKHQPITSIVRDLQSSTKQNPGIPVVSGFERSGNPETNPFSVVSGHPCPETQSVREHRDKGVPIQQRLRLCRVVTTPLTFAALLRSQMRTIADNDIECLLVSGLSAELESISRGLSLPCHCVEMSRDISIFQDIKSLFRLYKLFRSERFDIVHSSTAKAGLLVAVAAWLARVKIRVHTYTGQRWVELRGLRRWIVRLCDRIIAILTTNCYADSDSQRQFLISERIIRPSKIAVLASGSISGVNLDRFDSDIWKGPAAADTRSELGVDENATLVLFVGRVNRDKGIVELVSAFTSLDIAGKKVELVLVGPFEPEFDPLPRSVIDELTSNPRIHVVGRTREPERYIGAADILCLPSYREGFGSVVIEAAAMGVPAVATAIVGLVDAVEDGKTGLLAPPKDVDSLRKALSVMIADPELRDRMGRAARERAERLFDAVIVNQAVADEYRRLFSVPSGKDTWRDRNRRLSVPPGKDTWRDRACHSERSEESAFSENMRKEKRISRLRRRSARNDGSRKAESVSREPAWAGDMERQPK